VHDSRNRTFTRGRKESIRRRAVSGTTFGIATLTFMTTTATEIASLRFDACKIQEGVIINGAYLESTSPVALLSLHTYLAQLPRQLLQEL
jgi:hypothetical protein